MQTPQNNPFAIYYLSEQAVTLEFGNIISEELLQSINRINTLIEQHPFPGFETTVPAYATLSVFFNPLQVMQAHIPGNDCFEKVCNYLLNLQEINTFETNTPGNTITIPVCYGGSFGPDLDEVAAYHEITTQEVIKQHSAGIYKVYMIGFVPGFAYLGGMTSQLATPRKATPRAVIPAGSVGIAGHQTGVYPLQTPGGWQLIGRTPLLLFDANREQPALLEAGNQVIFQPVSQHEFAQYSQ